MVRTARSWPVRQARLRALKLLFSGSGRQRIAGDAIAAMSADVFKALFGRAPEKEVIDAVTARISDGSADLTTVALEWLLSQEALDRTVERAAAVHLHIIHHARLLLVRTLLPPAARILDLGGANAPLYRMGYPHPFQRLVLVDLPPADRHASYGQVSLERTRDGGEILVHYGDMTRLEGFADGSYDLVWSGQSIEHVSREDGARMCREAHRVLAPGGHFCLDTPNRLLTAIQTRPSGGGFIHPEHQFEYRPEELRTLLTGAGFEIVSAKGICEMPSTVLTGTFQYRDFVLGRQICDDPATSYIQYFVCRKKTILDRGAAQ